MATTQSDVRQTTTNPAHFNLDDTAAYQAWRESKLANYPVSIGQLVVEIKDPCKLTNAEVGEISARCNKANMAIYTCSDIDAVDKKNPRAIGTRFGLTNLDHNQGADDDGITSLRVNDDPDHREFIPYTSRAIHWHTDGYYNEPDRQIHGLLLHCARPAMEGGENALLDHEIAYILLRDRDPALIGALMAPDAMTIPAHIRNGDVIRPDRPGPVFSIGPEGRLHMRYTARAHNVIWRDNDLTRRAVAELHTLLTSSNPYTFRATLQPGQGLVSNNVLHDRSGFSDDPSNPRLLYRLRYFEPLRTRG